MAKPLESLTVEELAGLCGLTRNTIGQWTIGGEDIGQRRFVSKESRGPDWYAVADRSIVRLGTYATEHAALLALAKHLNLQPKEPTMESVRYVKIERDPKTDDYTDYQPREGDRWCFSRGGPWTVVVGSMSLYVGPKGEEKMYAVSHRHIFNLTTHIERPVRTVTVPKEGYQPQVGDRFCGPEGVVMTVTWFDRGLAYFGSGTCGYDAEQVARYVALCTRIERDQ